MKKLNTTETGWLTTYSGLKFRPTDPDPDSICALDIAHALSQIARFGGHTACPWSVGQHSMLVSALVLVPPSAEMRHGAKLQLQALLHDAPEAYIGDIVRPIKLMLPFYRRIESLVWKVIAAKFDVVQSLAPAIKYADAAAFWIEAESLLLKPKGHQWPGDEPSELGRRQFQRLVGMKPFAVEEEFLIRLDMLQWQANNKEAK